jgi:hypothetical protein
VIRQQGHIFGSRAQRRKRDLAAAEKLIQFAMEFPSSYHLCKVPAGPGDQSNVHWDGPASAKPRELLFLESTKKLFLKAEWQVPDLFKKKGSVVCELEASEPARNRPFKTPLFKAKKLSLQITCTECRAIQLDEDSIIAAAQLMSQAGDQLFAVSSLT